MADAITDGLLVDLLRPAPLLNTDNITQKSTQRPPPPRGSTTSHQCCQCHQWPASRQPPGPCRRQTRQPPAARMFREQAGARCTLHRPWCCVLRVLSVRVFVSPPSGSPTWRPFQCGSLQPPASTPQLAARCTPLAGLLPAAREHIAHTGHKG
jgi:hypothetical protein